MTAESYLQAILSREMVDTGPYSPVRSVHGILLPHIQQWADRWLLSMIPRGSFARGTANQSGTDIDMFISLFADTPDTLEPAARRPLKKALSASDEAGRIDLALRRRRGGSVVPTAKAQAATAFLLELIARLQSAAPFR